MDLKENSNVPPADCYNFIYDDEGLLGSVARSGKKSPLGLNNILVIAMPGDWRTIDY